MFWVILVYFNIRNTLPKTGTFLLGQPVYIYNVCVCVCVCVCVSVLSPFLLFSHAAVSYNFCLCLLTLHEPIPTKPMGHNTPLKVSNFTDNKEILAFYEIR